MSTPGSSMGRTGESWRVAPWTAALVVNLVLIPFALLAMVVRGMPGPSSYSTLTVENATKAPVLVTPMADREMSNAPGWWSGYWPGRGARGMYLIEPGQRRPGTRVGRFEVAPGATWSIRFDREGRWLAGVVVEGVGGGDGRVRVLHPTRTGESDPVTVRIEDLGAIPEATAQEAAWYAGIPADLGLNVVGAVLWLPLVNVPWVWWMWRRAKRSAPPIVE